MNHNACLCLCLIRDLYIALHCDCVYMVMVTKAWCISCINLPAITIEICNCHLQKIRQLSRNGICCMIALFLISISACDFHLKLLIHMLFAMKLSVCFYRPWAPPYWIIFRLHAKATESASTSLRRESQKLCALGKHFRWTFSGGVVYEIVPDEIDWGAQHQNIIPPKIIVWLSSTTFCKCRFAAKPLWTKWLLKLGWGWHYVRSNTKIAKSLEFGSTYLL